MHGKEKSTGQRVRDLWQHSETGISADENNQASVCSICGYSGFFERVHKSIREGYPCPNCRASLRYRHQAAVILEIFDNSVATFSLLVESNIFKNLSIYEPGVIGPFRKYLKNLKGYHQSYFWEGIDPGEFHKNIRCENLESLTFPDNHFDLIITSDIFEHIRKPFDAFKETLRVLKPGGWHVFTVPMSWPLPDQTRYRVDTSGAEDIHLKEPVYHGSPMDKNGSLVYTDFGMDLIARLNEMGFETRHKGFQYNLTFYAKKHKTD